MLRVAHVTSGITSRTGGTASALLSMAIGQARAGASVRVLATFTPGHGPIDSRETLAREGIELITVGPCVGPLQSHWTLGAKLRRMLASADVLHIHGLWEDVQSNAASLARKLKLPYVVSPHGMLDPWCMGQGSTKKKIYLRLRLASHLKHADLLHYTSPLERQLSMARSGNPRSVVEPIGLDISAFDHPGDREALRARYPQLGDGPVLLFLGRIDPKKGFDLLIPALARLRRTDARLLVAGPDLDGYQREVQAMIQAHGLRDRVVFAGMLTGQAKLDALGGADLFVLPSYQENFAIAVIETLACGTGVVISDQIGIHPDLAAAGCAEVVPTKLEPLVQTLDRVLDDPALLREMSDRGRRFVRESYDIHTVGRNWLSHYTALRPMPKAAAV